MSTKITRDQAEALIPHAKNVLKNYFQKLDTIDLWIPQGGIDQMVPLSGFRAFTVTLSENGLEDQVDKWMYHMTVRLKADSTLSDHQFQLVMESLGCRDSEGHANKKTLSVGGPLEVYILAEDDPKPENLKMYDYNVRGGEWKSAYPGCPND